MIDKQLELKLSYDELNEIDLALRNQKSAISEYKSATEIGPISGNEKEYTLLYNLIEKINEVL